MELSIFLAKAWGIFILIVCGSLLINRKKFKSIIRSFNDDLLILYGGIIALLIGIPQILTYNVWTIDWRGLITLLGWATFAKGSLLLLFPNKTKKFAVVLEKSNIYGIALLVYVLIGFYLTYQGFTQ